jgi:hypothetical protein
MVMPWQTHFKATAWLSLLVFFIGFVFFFVSYVGNNWYVYPQDHFHYPPDSQHEPIKLGLFWMCVLGHCKYDLRVDYMTVQYIPTKDIQDAFQNYRTVCMVIITIAACFCLVALALNLLFLTGIANAHFVGFAAGSAEVAAGVIALVGVIIFGSKFRGSTLLLPFGWSFWLMVAAFIILILDGIFTFLLASTISFQMRSKPKQLPGRGRPLIVNGH